MSNDRYPGAQGNAPAGPRKSPASASGEWSSAVSISVGVFGVIAVIALILFVLHLVLSFNAGGDAAPGGQSGSTSVDPNPGARGEATKGIGIGAYEPATDIWLSEKYAQGFNTWETEGIFVGPSADKKVVGIISSSGNTRHNEFIGYEVATGVERWRVKRTDIGRTCPSVHNGIAYCTAIDSGKARFLSIDLGTGEEKTLLNSDYYGLSTEFVGVQRDLTFWQGNLMDRSESSNVSKRMLLAIKDEKVVWSAELPNTARCTLLDGVLGCETRDDNGSLKVDMISAQTGQTVSQISGDYTSAQYFQDAVVAVKVSGNPDLYDLHGRNIGEIENPLTGVWPSQAEGYLYPVALVRDNPNPPKGVFDPEGKALAVLEWDGASGEHNYVVPSTKAILGKMTETRNVYASDKGDVFLSVKKAGVEQTFTFIDKNGRKIGEVQGDKYALEGGILALAGGGGGNDRVMIVAPKN
ncbi:MAG: hypothetical protein Q4C87_01400 [Actinomycetaceae bacterium]|nr:hypothetical protein [Actinomycetaceae bacterium]